MTTKVLNLTSHQLKLPNIVRAEGYFIYSHDGKRFVDLESGVWCLSLGHNHPAVKKAIMDQLDKVMHVGFCYASEAVQEATALLTQKAGLPDGGAVFLCSGSEAIELARQLSKHLTKNKRTIAFHDAYLGAYASVKNRDADWVIFDWQECECCEKKATCDASCPKIEAIPEDVGDFVFEPGSAAGFVRFAPIALVCTVVNAVRARGGKIIVNDVTTGVGRTGKWFGYQHYDFLPDMIAVGKGIGNGYPVSATIVSSEIIDELTHRPYIYAQSHQNDPLGARVVSSVIQFIEQHHLIENAEKTGRWLKLELQNVVDGDAVLGVRGRGLMIAVDLRDEQVTEHYYAELMERGFIVGNRKTALRIDPSLTTDRKCLINFIDAFKEIRLN